MTSSPALTEPPTEPGPHVRLERPLDHVAEIVLDRPDALNAVSTELAGQLQAACEAAGADPAVRAVVLSSAVAKAFCVGADLKERNRLSDDELRASRLVARAAYRSVLDLPVPVVAAVHGFALGGGLELALACDLIVADPSAVARAARGERRRDPRWWRHPAAGPAAGLVPRRRPDLHRPAARRRGGRPDRAGRPAGRPGRRTGPWPLELAGAIAANSPVGVRNAKRAMRDGPGPAAGRRARRRGRPLGRRRRSRPTGPRACGRSPSAGHRAGQA